MRFEATKKKKLSILSEIGNKKIELLPEGLDLPVLTAPRWRHHG